MTERDTQLAVIVALVKRAPKVWPEETAAQLGYVARRMSSAIQKQNKTTETS
jgi:hypothetical protein